MNTWGTYCISTIPIIYPDHVINRISWTKKGISHILYVKNCDQSNVYCSRSYWFNHRQYICVWWIKYVVHVLHLFGSYSQMLYYVSHIERYYMYLLLQNNWNIRRVYIIRFLVRKNDWNQGVKPTTVVRHTTTFFETTEKKVVCLRSTVIATIFPCFVLRCG